MWYIAECVLNSLSALVSVGISHQDVQPKNISVASSTGQIRLIDFHCYDPIYNSGYVKMKSDYTYHSPISPQLMKNYFSRSSKVPSNKEKDDVWSLGITLICAAAVCGFGDFYDFTYGTINHDKIRDRLAWLEKIGYSSYFVKCVGNMVNANEDYRPNIKEVIKFIVPLK